MESTSDCVPGKKYLWKTRDGQQTEVFECRKSVKGNNLVWGTPGNPYSSSTTALKTCGWIFTGETAND